MAKPTIKYRTIADLIEDLKAGLRTAKIGRLYTCDIAPFLCILLIAVTGLAKVCLPDDVIFFTGSNLAESPPRIVMLAAEVTNPAQFAAVEVSRSVEVIDSCNTHYPAVRVRGLSDILRILLATADPYSGVSKDKRVFGPRARYLWRNPWWENSWAGIIRAEMSGLELFKPPSRFIYSVFSNKNFANRPFLDCGRLAEICQLNKHVDAILSNFNHGSQSPDVWSLVGNEVRLHLLHRIIGGFFSGCRSSLHFKELVSNQSGVSNESQQGSNLHGQLDGSPWVLLFAFDYGLCFYGAWNLKFGRRKRWYGFAVAFYFSLIAFAYDFNLLLERFVNTR